MGLGHPDKLTAVKHWLASKGRDLQLIAFQELKAGEQTLEFNIKTLIPGATCIVDYTSSDRGGAALVIHPSVKVESSGVRGDGTFAWARVAGGRRKRVKRFSYLKMDVESLKCPTRGAKARRAWEDGWKLSPDPIIAWEMAWGKMRDQFKEFRREDKEALSVLQVKQADLMELRLQLAEQTSRDLEETYVQLEQEVRGLELLEASIARRRSRITWLKAGEASSKYFFSCLKSKHCREKMGPLRDTSGTLIEDKDKVMEHIHNFYTNLYHQPEGSRQQATERRRVLSLINKFVTAGENDLLINLPDQTEIDQTVKDLPKDKALGEDGVTAEILQYTWEWTSEPCSKFLSAVWEEKRCGNNNKAAVVKLLPKNEHKEQLKIWRLISLLSLTYKLIRRILAKRLKKILLGLVDDDQTGFVEGMHIMDNV
ncbi:hypothetical protein R1sor_020823 [Riccia sorocarpa]|uniref:Reverse transcriptase domain-containing protein n=1 Tax=Riccia sorocarpa TaxID=122646 RepID=A0ABD3GFA3_9MARC